MNGTITEDIREVSKGPANPHKAEDTATFENPLTVGLLTGGGDKPYALGIASALVSKDVHLDFIGSDQVNGPELHNTPLISFLNLRGDQRSDTSGLQKLLRVVKYYGKLIAYASRSRAAIFHILWNNKFEVFDRTLLLMYYRCLGKRLVRTVHNVNAGERDGNDSFLNRLTLRIQYHLSDHCFVHTKRMKEELIRQFAVPESRITVVPFGINNTLPSTELTSLEAKKQLGVGASEKIMLSFGHIAPYKGIEFLVEALSELLVQDSSYRLIIAGSIKNCDEYWSQIEACVKKLNVREHVLAKIGYISDEDVEIYFKAADVLVLPYRHVFQSGVLFLGYSFGLPVIATDVGSLKEDIIEGETGYVCSPENALELATTIKKYFASDLFDKLPAKRNDIRKFANERYSWSIHAEMTEKVYRQLVGSSKER